jgi:2-amino-4-hydroxy-6-hydroxymethyldihydropteridine diphosphokinase
VRTFRNGPRSIDVDLLDLGGVVRRSSDPVLPHPRMARRRFVLAPLAEIAPAWRHPVRGLSARRLLAALPARPRARRIGRI